MPTFSRTLNALVILIGSLTFLGYILRIPHLVHVAPSPVAMNPVTAILLIISGIALWLRRDTATSSSQLVLLSQGLSLLVTVIGACKFIDYLVGLPVHVDQVLFPSTVAFMAQWRPAEMAPNTALSFLFVGPALLFFHTEERNGFRPAQAFVLATGLIALVALIGYLYGSLALNRLGPLKPMPLTTAIAFALFFLGFLAAQPNRGFMLALTSRTTGGSMARRLLPMAIFVPLLLGFLLLAGEQARFYRQEFAITLFAVTNILSFTVLIWWNARLLYRSDVERELTERRLAAQHDATRVLAESANLAKAMPRLLQTICEALGWRVGALWVEDPRTQQLRCAEIWHSGAPGQADFVEKSRTISFASGSGLPGRVWAESRPLWITDMTSEPNLSRGLSATRANLHGAFAFPIRLEHEFFGVLEFFSPVIEKPDPALLEMMGIVGTQIALFIERTRAEERLRQTTANLQRSNTELQEFAHVASHDLFEPLRMVTSYLQLLQQNYQAKLDQRANEFITFALDGAKRMDALIHDLLDYSRVEVRGRPFEPTNTEYALAAALSNLKIAIEETGATVSYGQLPRVIADSVQLTQVFQNLVGNAIKFHGSESPRIEVAAHRRENEWLFFVRDNGIGIDPKFFDTIFVIFQRLHTRREYSGTGMGLAICKKIIERHGGRIWVESVPGKGATFFFTLPARDESQRQESAQKQSP